MAHHMTAPAPVPASGPGALDGFESRCTTCTFVARSSLVTITHRDAWEHWAYMAAREAASRPRVAAR